MITNSEPFSPHIKEIPQEVKSLIQTMAQAYFPEFACLRSESPEDGELERLTDYVRHTLAQSLTQNVPVGLEEWEIITPSLCPCSAPTPLDVQAIRKDFPILKEKVHGKDLVWFDNAATTQKPIQVIDRLKYFYAHENSNVHRGAHALAARTTDAFEGARRRIARFINAEPQEIVFVRGTTEGINLVAQSYGLSHLKEGDEIILSHLEHHANIVPWQMLCARTGAKLRIIPVDDNGQILLDQYARLLSDRTKMVAITQVSNALGTITPVEQMIAMAHQWGARVLVDGAQAIAHIRVDVKALDCDFYVFSGHKIYGPTGIGVVYGKSALLEAMAPYQGGGSMIEDVTFEQSKYKAPPYRFEAGTANFADAIALGSAIDYVDAIGIEAIFAHEHALLEHARACLSEIPGLRLIGNAREKTSILSFIMEGHTTDEIGKALDKEGIAVRTGHHCSQPILRRFGLETTVRASLALYNTLEEVDTFAAVLRKLAER